MIFFFVVGYGTENERHETSQRGVHFIRILSRSVNRCSCERNYKMYLVASGADSPFAATRQVVGNFPE
jgi:hypothetical protein